MKLSGVGLINLGISFVLSILFFAGQGDIYAIALINFIAIAYFTGNEYLKNYLKSEEEEKKVSSRVDNEFQDEILPFMLHTLNVIYIFTVVVHLVLALRS